MAIPPSHVPFYEEIFALPGFLADPVLTFGYQEIRIPDWHFQSWSELDFRDRLRRLGHYLWRCFETRSGRGFGPVRIPETYRHKELSSFLQQYGMKEVHVLDLFDARATLRYDMNQQLGPSQHGQYGTLIDIGSLEHVFDTRQCLENCLRLIRLGGHYLLHTTVNGYFAHGLHVFNPQGLIEALEANGFEVIYKRYSTASGRVVDNPDRPGDILIWLVSRKVAELDNFIPPQQGYWEDYYRLNDFKDRMRLQREYWAGVK